MQTKFIFFINVILIGGSSFFYNAYLDSFSKESHLIIYNNKPINGEAFYKQQCGFCHNKEELMAPDMQKIKAVYLQKFKDKEEFVKAIVSFVKNPDKSKSIYKDGIDNFANMPKMPFKDAQVNAVAAYIYDTKTL